MDCPLASTVHSRDKSRAGLEMVGFNCATCHVGEVKYRGKIFRIDGAPPLVDLQSYQVEFKDSFEATLSDPAKAVKLVIAIDREQHAGDTARRGASGYASATVVKTASEVAASGTANQNLHSVSSQAGDAASGEAGGEQEPPLAVGSGSVTGRRRRMHGATPVTYTQRIASALTEPRP